MTLDEAKEVAREVLANKTRSHVQAAKELAAFVAKLRSVSIELSADEAAEKVKEAVRHPEGRGLRASLLGLADALERDGPRGATETKKEG